MNKKLAVSSGVLALVLALLHLLIPIIRGYFTMSLLIMVAGYIILGVGLLLRNKIAGCVGSAVLALTRGLSCFSYFSISHVNHGFIVLAICSLMQLLAFLALACLFLSKKRLLPLRIIIPVIFALS